MGAISIKHSEKILFGNFASLSVLKIYNLIIPFVTLPYLIDVLDFSAYGVIVLSLSLNQYFHTFTTYGFNYTATRDIAKHRHSSIQLSYIYFKYMFSILLLLSVSLVVYVVIINIIPSFKESLLVFGLASIILVGNSLFPEWFFRGIEKMYFITLLDVSVKTILTVGVFIFIREESDFWKYPIILGTGYIIVSTVSHYIIIRKFIDKIYWIPFKWIKKCLIDGYPLFVNQFIPNFYNNTTGMLIGILLGNYYAGVFGAIRQVVNLLNVFNSVVTSVFFPYLVRNGNSFKTYSKYYSISFFLMCVLFITLLPFILDYIGVNSNDYTLTASYLVFGVYSLSLFNIFGTNYLLRLGFEKLVMRIVVFCSLLGFVLSWLLINSLGIEGGSINIALCQFLMGSISIWFYKKN